MIPLVLDFRFFHRSLSPCVYHCPTFVVSVFPGCETRHRRGLRLLRAIRYRTNCFGRVQQSRYIINLRRWFQTLTYSRIDTYFSHRLFKRFAVTCSCALVAWRTSCSHLLNCCDIINNQLFHCYSVCFSFVYTFSLTRHVHSKAVVIECLCG